MKTAETGRKPCKKPGWKSYINWKKTRQKSNKQGLKQKKINSLNSKKNCTFFRFYNIVGILLAAKQMSWPQNKDLQ